MKRILLMLCLLFMFIQNVNAANTTFELTEAKGMKGDTITVKLKINSNPSFGILGAKLDYDETKLEYESSKIIGLDNAMMKDAAESKGVVTLYAFSIDKDKLMDDTGDIFEVQFKILSDESEESKIKLEITDFAIDEVESLRYTANDGIVAIEKSKNKVSTSDTISLKDKIDKQKVQWKSSNSDIAVVDENGNVTFKKNGDVTITATDGEKVIFEKEYRVDDNKKDNKQNNNIFIIVCVSLVVILGIGVFYIIKNKNEKRKK